jgi:hypothetical protein
MRPEELYLGDIVEATRDIGRYIGEAGRER